MVLASEEVSAMSDAEGAIYVPPKDGLPFLVVTFADGDIRTETASTRSEARVLLARRTRRRVVAERAGVTLHPVKAQ
jgi:hypothetical protein